MAQTPPPPPSWKPPDPPEPPVPASDASDGDIRGFYAAYLADYISGAGTSARRQAPQRVISAEISSAETGAGGDLSWFDLYVQDLKHEWELVKALGHTTANVAVSIDERVQFWIDLWNEAVERWHEFLEGRDLDEIRVDGAKLTSRIITLRDAEDVIEQLRLKNLKEFFETKIQEIKDAIENIKNPLNSIQQAGDADSVDQLDKPGEAAKAMIGTNQILDSIQDIGRAVVTLIEKFDIITQMELDMEAKVLPQNNFPESYLTKDDYQGRRSRN